LAFIIRYITMHGPLNVKFCFGYGGSRFLLKGGVCLPDYTVSHFSRT